MTLQHRGEVKRRLLGKYFRGVGEVSGLLKCFPILFQEGDWGVTLNVGRVMWCGSLSRGGE